MAAAELRDLYQRLTSQTGLEPSDEHAERDVLARVRAQIDIHTTDR